jgi:HAD superfamily phosphoserine phosphatase-like hydrolase
MAGRRIKYKLVIFDLDGTIIDGTDSIWKTMHEFLGIYDHPKRIELRDKFMSGRISYAEWAEKDMELMIAHGIDRDKMFRAMKNLKLVKGARETLEKLKARGMKLALVSGSLDIVLEKFIPDYRKIFSHVYIVSVIFDERGRVKAIDACHDAWNKHIALLEICKAEGITPDECVFVGDHSNDVSAAKAAGLSIAFDPKSAELKKAADVVIEKKDLRGILKII